MTPSPRATDQRQAREIALAIVAELEALGGVELAAEGSGLLKAPNDRIDWAALLGWNRRACEWIAAHRPARRR